MEDHSQSQFAEFAASIAQLSRQMLRRPSIHLCSPIYLLDKLSLENLQPSLLDAHCLPFFPPSPRSVPTKFARERSMFDARKCVSRAHGRRWELISKQFGKTRCDIRRRIGNGPVAGKKFEGSSSSPTSGRGSYEIPAGGIEWESESDERAPQQREKVGGRRRRTRKEGGARGLSPQVKEIIGDISFRPLRSPPPRRPFEMAILSNPPRVLPVNGECPHISVPTVMDIVERTGWGGTAVGRR